VELLPTGNAEVETIARLWERDSILFSLALYIDAQEIETTFAGETAATTSPAPSQSIVFSPAAASRRLSFLACAKRGSIVEGQACRWRWPSPLALNSGMLARHFAQAFFSPLVREAFDDPAAGEFHGDAETNAAFNNGEANTNNLSRGVWSNLSSVLAGQFDLDVASIRRIVYAVLARFPAAWESRTIDREAFIRWLRRELWMNAALNCCENGPLGATPGIRSAVARPGRAQRAAADPAADCPPSQASRPGLLRMGFRARDFARPGHQRALRR